MFISTTKNHNEIHVIFVKRQDFRLCLLIFISFLFFFLGMCKIFATRLVNLKWYIFITALSQNVQIQAVPPTVKYLENDLVIVCSITNPSSIKEVVSLELLRNESEWLQTIVSINKNQAPHWKNTFLKRRATVSGSVNDTNSAELKFSIDKNNVLCPDDFTMYKCKMSGHNYINSSNNTVHDEDQITITYTSMNYLNFHG